MVKEKGRKPKIVAKRRKHTGTADGGGDPGTSAVGGPPAHPGGPVHSGSPVHTGGPVHMGGPVHTGTPPHPAPGSTSRDPAPFTKTKRDGTKKLDLKASAPTRRAAPRVRTPVTADTVTPSPKRRRTLAPQSHKDLPDGAKVHLRPAIKVNSDGEVEGVTISSLQRTPSPFGARMGDHTTAWQGHVDSLRAELHGLPIVEATEKVREMQAEVDAEMQDQESVSARLFAELDADDAERRAPRMEDAAYQVSVFCDEAVKAGGGDSETAAKLSLAVAQHLAYKNYRPFTTVPPNSDRGSVGSGEGQHRNNLVDFENERRKAEKEMSESQKHAERKKLATDHPDAMLLDGSLWGMFAFDAALRDSHIEYALDPTLVTTVATDVETLQEVGDSLMSEMNAPSARTADEVRELMDKAAKVATRPGQDDRVFLAASKLKEIAESFNTLLLSANTTTGKRKIAELSGNVPDKVAEAKQALDAIKQRADHAPARAALVLAYLLHEHQRTMAPAYPHAVIASGFLPVPDTETDPADITMAAEAAVAQLEYELRRQYPELFKDDEPAKLADVLEALQNEYVNLPPIAVPLDSHWVEHAKNADLVVVYDHGKVPAFSVNGRAPAPNGVAGMGCHTTAWAIEQQHPDALVHGSADAKEALKRLRTAVVKDAGSAVMTLDSSLPFDQIEAGQVTAAYKAAFQVLKANDVGSAATAYLTFRNLLPYATVDAGDRGGHAEKQDADRTTTFDDVALQYAADLKEAELMEAAENGPLLGRQKRDLLEKADVAQAEGRQDDADGFRAQAAAIQLGAERLRAAADELDALAKEVAVAAPGGEDGKPYKGLRTAMAASARRLRDKADDVAGGKFVSVRRTIVDTRKAEHTRVWNEVHEFRKKPRTKDDKTDKTDKTEDMTDV